MSKKKTPSVGDPGPDASDADKRTPLERERDRQEQDMLELISRARLNDGIVAIKRRSVNEVEFGTLPDMPASAFSEDNILKIYGGGDYKVQFKTSAGKFVGQAAFKIDYSIPPKYPGRAMDSEKRESTADIIAAVTAAVKQSIPPPIAPQQDNTILLKMMEQNTAILTAALARGDSNANGGMKEMLADLKAEIRELKSNANQANRPQGLTSAIKDYMALQEIIGGGGGGDDDAPKSTDWKEKLFDVFGPVVAALVMKGMNIDPNAQQLTPEQQAQMTAALQQQQNQTQLTAPAGAARDAAAGVAASSQLNPAKPVTDMNPLFKIYLVEFRRLAIQAATKGRDAFEWADAKMDDIDEKYHEKIFELANKETWFAEIFATDAIAITHFKWLLDMRNMILTRWLVADVVKAYGETPRVEPEVYAKGFVDRASLSFHDTLVDLTDPEAWQQTFVLHELDAVWLEKLRGAFVTVLDVDEEVDTAVTSPATTKLEEPQPDKASRKKTK
jgi:hypothetical protein